MPGAGWSIAHVITELALGGAQLTTLAQCARAPFGTGRRFLLAGPGGMLDATAARLPGVERLVVPALGRALRPGRDLRALAELVAALRRCRARVAPGRLLVHTHSSKAGVLGRLAARLAGADCCVHSIHGFGYGPDTAVLRRLLLRQAERTVGRLTDGFTADCAAHLGRGRAEGLIGAQPCATVHCGVDLAAFARAPAAVSRLRAELGVPAAAPLVLQLANLKPQKDPLALVRLAHRLAPRWPQARFLLAGDGPLRAAVAREVAARGLAGRVLLLGWRHDVAALLHASDLLCLTSRWEGLPQVFGQAMAAGLAIVATDVDGAREAVSMPHSGLVVPAGDDTALAVAVAELLADPARRARMGRAGRRLAGQFSEAAMLTRLAALYGAACAAVEH